jgi:hypothetical protein
LEDLKLVFPKYSKILCKGEVIFSFSEMTNGSRYCTIQEGTSVEGIGKINFEYCGI